MKQITVKQKPIYGNIDKYFYESDFFLSIVFKFKELRGVISGVDLV